MRIIIDIPDIETEFPTVEEREQVARIVHHVAQSLSWCGWSEGERPAVDHDGRSVASWSLDIDAFASR